MQTFQTPFVTSSSVGRMGRFGNSFFQYMFLHTYAHKHGLTAYNLPWVGDDMFEVVRGVEELPTAEKVIQQQWEKRGRVRVSLDVDKCAIVRQSDPFKNADFQGYFQYHTSYYQPHKELIEQHYTFKGDYAQAANKIARTFASFKKPVVALHLRRGDYGYNIFFITPNKWYLNWLEDLKKTVPDFVVYIASDDPEAVLPDFAEYQVITEKDLPFGPKSPGYFKDFAALTLADYVGISNSSFSFGATMLNKRGKGFVRPSLTDMQLVPFDPWNAPVLLTDKIAEDAGDAFVNARVRAKPRYKLNKLKRFLLG